MPLKWPVLVAVLISVAGHANAQQGLEQNLKLIRETAADICYTIEQRGQKTDVQLQGEVAAKLTGVFGKVADIGGGANGTLTREEFQGLSEEAVAAALEKSANCRERVFNKLIDKIPLDSLIPPPPKLACGGINNAKSPYIYSGDLTSNSFLVKVPECGSFTLIAKMSNYVFGPSGPIGPDTPPVDHIIDVKESLCLETGRDIPGAFVRIHIDRDCGSRSGPTSQVYYRRSTAPFSDPSISNWGEILKSIREKNAEFH